MIPKTMYRVGLQVNKGVKVQLRVKTGKASFFAHPANIVAAHGIFF